LIILSKVQTYLLPFIRKVPFSFKKVVISSVQFCLGLLLLISLYAAARCITSLYGLSFPPAILGIVALFIGLIALRRVPKSVYGAGKPLLAHMSLFFLPAIVAIVNYTDLVQQFPLALFLAIVITTLMSLALTALLAQWLMHQLNPESEGQQAQKTEVQTISTLNKPSLPPNAVEKQND
jgi:holin-like protein